MYCWSDGVLGPSFCVLVIIPGPTGKGGLMEVCCISERTIPIPIAAFFAAIAYVMLLRSCMRNGGKVIDRCFARRYAAQTTHLRTYALQKASGKRQWMVEKCKNETQPAQVTTPSPMLSKPGGQLGELGEGWNHRFHQRWSRFLRIDNDRVQRVFGCLS